MSDAAGDYHQVLRQYFEAAETPLPRMQALGTVEGVKRGILAGGMRSGSCLRTRSSRNFATACWPKSTSARHCAGS